MSVLSESYNRAHNILELVDILPIFLSQPVKGNVIIADKNVKYELTDELPEDVRLEKISELHRIIVQFYLTFPLVQ